MRYKVIWHDAEDERSGSPFYVIADSPSSAYFMAVDEIEGYGVKGFIHYDIECLMDEEGNYLNPNNFLGEDKASQKIVSPFELDKMREELSHGENATQNQIDQIVQFLIYYKQQLRPDDKDELLPLVDRNGKLLGTTAPRWICHLLGLRHRCAHVLLIWKSLALGDAMIFQIRSWDKDESPGRIDISVGGHLKAMDSDFTEKTAFNEMLEEVALKANDLEVPLEYAGGYSSDESRPKDHFNNYEWRDVYIGYVKQDRIGHVNFADGEVAGLVIVELDRAQDFLEQSFLPLASALRESLPICLKALLNKG